jgi:RNA-binding protein PNO1
MSEFLPASAASSKARKTALKQSNKPGQQRKSNNGTNKKPSNFLPTQPSTGLDSDMMDIERLPLDSRTAEQKKAAAEKLTQIRKVSDKDAAMAMDQDNNDEDDDDDDDDAVMIDPSSLSAPTPVTRTPIAEIEAAEQAAGGPSSLVFPAVSHSAHINLTQRRKVSIPPHRMTPLKRDWIKIYTPLVEECGLQVRMNVHKKWIEMKVSSLGAVQTIVATRAPC